MQHCRAASKTQRGWFLHLAGATLQVSMGEMSTAGRELTAAILVVDDEYERLGLHVSYGGPNAAFTTMRAARSVINLRHAPQGSGNRWARVILRVRGVDALYQHLRAQGLHPSTPKNAAWGERYLEISDPDGDVISFAELLDAIH